MLYKDAGVDISNLNLVRKAIGKEVLKTYNTKLKPTFGLFGAVYPLGKYYLISSVDSVGTKILVACGMNIHDTIGQDIVNHCINDILTTGAQPIFFMDYIGFSELKNKIIVQIVKGIATACKRERIALIGGETASLTRFYPKGIYDLVGFITGIVSKKRYINTSKIKAGDLLIGIKSSGLHTNGYSLARKVLLRKFSFNSYIPELKCTLGEELLKIHTSYKKYVLPRLKFIKGIAHITGGGFYDNIKRILPTECNALIRKKTWRPQPIFQIIKKLGNVPDREMYRVFNMGIGMVLVVDKKRAKNFISPKTKLIGEIIKGNREVQII